MPRRAGISEEQIELARTDLATPIFHRTILRMATDGWVNREGPAKA